MPKALVPKALVPKALEPLRRELVEGPIGLRIRDGIRLDGLPDAALDVGKEMSEFALGARTIPAFLGDICASRGTDSPRGYAQIANTLKTLGPF